MRSWRERGASWAGQEWGLVLVAVQMLTCVPVAAPHGSGVLRMAARYVPLVGIGIGLVGAGAYWGVGAGLPPVLAGVATVGATLLLTGALHEDGLADCCDGVFGGRDRAAALRIMRDSRVGAFGVLGLGLVVGAKIACVASLRDAGVALVAGHACSRFWMVTVASVLPYARVEGMAGGIAGPGRLELVVAGLFGLVPLLLLGPRAVPALVASGLAMAGVAWWAGRRLGGYTGDVLGAVQQVSELAVLGAVLWHVD